MTPEIAVAVVSWNTRDVLERCLRSLEPDVEAVLLRRLGPQEFSCHVVPVDRCYELVGLVRSRWAGLSGGNELWATVADFFTGLDAQRGRR